MSNRQRVVIRKLATGVPGLDDVLGGGLPEYSFNVLAGAPGTGKTTLAQQILFANATPDRPGLFFTVLGEPAVKMLRYQQQFTFFDPARVGRDVHFLNLSEEVLNESLDVILDRVSAEIERVHSRDRRRGLLPHRCTRGRSAAGQQRAGAPALRATSRAPPHELGGHFLPDWRVRRRRVK